MKIPRLKSVLLVASISVLFGCESKGKSDLPLEPVEITELVRFGDNLITDSPKRISVVRNQEQFEIEWGRISSEQMPVVDFSGTYVVIAEMGYQSSGRGHIEIVSALSSEQHSEVRVTTSVAGRNCQVHAALNSPYHVVTIPRSGRDVVIKEEYEVVDCEQ